jgi:hypothetical protein
MYYYGALIDFVYDDGGRAAAGYRGMAGDCVVRAIAIVTGQPYKDVYDAINLLAKAEKRSPRHRNHSSARNGVYTKTYRPYLQHRGLVWVPTMRIGQGCTVHLRADELPAGRLLVQVTKHLTAVIDGVIHDTHDPSRDGTRCVYGYWVAADAPTPQLALFT